MARGRNKGRTNSMFEEQKKAYWWMRDELLMRYANQWVAIANGALVANGDSASKVMLEAYRKTESKVLYVNKVGDEKRAMRKWIRRYTVGRYDLAPGGPQPSQQTPFANATPALWNIVAWSLLISLAQYSTGPAKDALLCARAAFEFSRGLWYDMSRDQHGRVIGP